MSSLQNTEGYIQMGHWTQEASDKPLQTPHLQTDQHGHAMHFLNISEDIELIKIQTKTQFYVARGKSPSCCPSKSFFYSFSHQGHTSACQMLSKCSDSVSSPCAWRKVLSPQQQGLCFKSGWILRHWFLSVTNWFSLQRFSLVFLGSQSKAGSVSGVSFPACK